MAADQETTLDMDFVVVGSGAGGAVIAATVANAGHRVLVLEAGCLQTPETFTQRELGRGPRRDAPGGGGIGGAGVVGPPRGTPGEVV